MTNFSSCYNVFKSYFVFWRCIKLCVQQLWERAKGGLVQSECSLVDYLTLSLIQTLSDASTADHFLKTGDKRRNCSKQANSFLLLYNHCIQLLFFHFQRFSEIFHNSFQKSSAADLLYVGKGYSMVESFLQILCKTAYS